jgi:hypothetical protein
MEQLYVSRGGKEEFNCVNLNLTREDIFSLEKAVSLRLLPKTEGFFFGQDSSMDDDTRDYDLKFIEEAFQELAEGKKLYYFAWY